MSDCSELAQSSISQDSYSTDDSILKIAAKKNVFNIVLLNARSLKDKLQSFNKTLNKLAADICLVTETWFQNTDQINNELEDFMQTTEYSFLRKDRASGRRGGGIAIVFNHSKIQMSKAKILPTKHEVFVAVGRRMGQRRKIVVLVIYIPPWYNAQQNQSLFNYTNDALLAIKNKYEDPIILVGGDFNRRDFCEATREYPDIKPIVTGPTRGLACLDIIGTNVNQSLIDAGSMDPIESNTGALSDHRTVFVQLRMPRVPSYTVQKYSYFYISAEGTEKFGRWLRATDWSSLERLNDTTQMVTWLHNKFEEGMSSSFTQVSCQKII